jgi:hypothetical protein
MRKINVDKIVELVYLLNQEKCEDLTCLRFDYNLEFINYRLDFFAYIGKTPFWQKASDYFRIKYNGSYMTGSNIGDGVFWRNIPFCLEEELFFKEFKNFLLEWSKLVEEKIAEGASLPLNVKAIRRTRSILI